jgi:hypothetical protein
MKAVRSDEMESNGQPTNNITPVVQTQSILIETGTLLIRFTAVQPSCEMSHRNPLAAGTLVHVEERGQLSGFCKSKEIECLSRLQYVAMTLDAGRMRYVKSMGLIEMKFVVAVGRALFVKDIERWNGDSSYKGRKGSRFNPLNHRGYYMHHLL